MEKKWKEKKRQRLLICPIFLFHIVFNRYLVYCVDVIYCRYACLMVPPPPPPWLMTEPDKLMRWQLNHDESPDGSWRNEISDESWRIMKNPDGSWRNEISDESWRISWWILTKWDGCCIMKFSWWTLDGCGSPIGSYAHFSQNDVHKGGLK